MSAESTAEFLEREMKELGLLHEVNWILKELHALPIKQAKSQAEDVLIRRKSGEPLAYILGHWDFRKLTLAVGPGVLIPRPETEEIVDHALAHIDKYQQNFSPRPFRVADLGAGTGAIAYSLLQESKKNIQVTAIEKNADAFAYLQKNLNVLRADKKSKVELIFSDWNETPLQATDLIISNPPYVSALEYESLDKSVRSYEPIAALVPENDTSNDAFSAYEAILKLAQKVLAPGGSVLMEFGPAQTKLWAHKIPNDFNYKIFKDLSGKDRFLYAFDFSVKTR